MYVVVTFIICYMIFKQHIYIVVTFIMCYTSFKQHVYAMCSPWHMFLKKSNKTFIYFV